MILPTEATTNSRPILADEIEIISSAAFLFSPFHQIAPQTCDIVYRNFIAHCSRRRRIALSLIRQDYREVGWHLRPNGSYI